MGRYWNILAGRIFCAGIFWLTEYCVELYWNILITFIQVAQVDKRLLLE
jgi:hypothetical protein